MPSTLVAKGSVDVEATQVLPSQTEIGMGLVVWGAGARKLYLPIFVCFLMPCLCSLSSLFKIHGLCLHACGMWNINSKCVRVHLLCGPNVYLCRAHRYTHTTSRFPSSFCLIGVCTLLFICGSVCCGSQAVFLFLRSLALQNMSCAWHIVWTQ